MVCEVIVALPGLRNRAFTHVALTESAAVAWHTHTLEVVESVQTRGAVQTRVRLALIQVGLTPETSPEL